MTIDDCRISGSTICEKCGNEKFGERICPYCDPSVIYGSAINEVATLSKKDSDWLGRDHLINLLERFAKSVSSLLDPEEAEIVSSCWIDLICGKSFKAELLDSGIVKIKIENKSSSYICIIPKP